MNWLDAELIQAINEISWFDGIGTLVVLLVVYAIFKRI